MIKIIFEMRKKGVFRHPMRHQKTILTLKVSIVSLKQIHPLLILLSAITNKKIKVNINY